MEILLAHEFGVRDMSFGDFDRGKRGATLLATIHINRGWAAALVYARLKNSSETGLGWNSIGGSAVRCKRMGKSRREFESLFHQTPLLPFVDSDQMPMGGEYINGRLSVLGMEGCGFESRFPKYNQE